VIDRRRTDINFALKSDHADATAYGLAASEALLKVDPEWDGSYYFRGRALVKSSEPAEAIAFYEKALGMTASEDDKDSITTALEEARAAVLAAERASQSAPASN